MKNQITRKSLIKKLRTLHTQTRVEEVQERSFLEAFINDLTEGFWNIHEAARIIKGKGFAI